MTCASIGDHIEAFAKAHPLLAALLTYHYSHSMTDEQISARLLEIHNTKMAPDEVHDEIEFAKALIARGILY